MRVLWLCNMMLPVIAEQFGIEASNKEGWLSGLADMVLRNADGNGLELAVAAPAPKQLFEEAEEHQGFLKRKLTVQDESLTFYGFKENTARPDLYEAGLEQTMQELTKDFEPDVVHCFGTEYPHTLAMCRSFSHKERLLVGIQGICAICADAYFADLPERAIRRVTLRDFLKKDSILQQQEKFVRRGRMEREALGLAGNITGRTEWDRRYAAECHPAARYFHLNETLRPNFYGQRWSREDCIPHSIFLSQGDYPVKGLHYMLEALPKIKEKYPDARVYVAGNSLVNDRTVKQRLKMSAYGVYLRELLQKRHLEDSVVFLGRLDAEQMRERYQKSHLFVCCSSIENSPNSLGEAMLLGMPCVSADVGGISGIFTGGEDGILYEGFQIHGNTINNMRNQKNLFPNGLEKVSKSLAEAVIEMWSNEEKITLYCENARKHAEKNHDKVLNYEKMKEIYAKITERREDC